MQVQWKVSIKSWEKKNSHHLLKALMFLCFSGPSSRVFGIFSRPRTKKYDNDTINSYFWKWDSNDGNILKKKNKQNHTAVVIPLRTAFSFPTMASCLFIQNQTLSSCLIAVMQAANIYLIVKPEYHFQSAGCTQSPDCQRRSIKLKASLWGQKLELRI